MVILNIICNVFQIFVIIKVEGKKEHCTSIVDLWQIIRLYENLIKFMPAGNYFQ